MTSILMGCGHTAQAIDGDNNPVCAICIGINPKATIVVMERPSLEGRLAHCSYKHRNDGARHWTGAFEGKEIVDSDWNLAFFEYRGPESEAATKHCVCGYFEPAHAGPNMGEWMKRPGHTPISDHEFTPHGAYDYDLYYCGCRGWD